MIKTNIMLKEALNYVRAGYKIFPVIESGKAPATQGGFLVATDNIEQIKNWWSENPNYNIGLPMELNGLICIDIDRHGDVDGFVEFENYILSYDLSDLPITVEANTANNGRHKIYKVPKGFKPPGKLTKGVDLKYRGYVVVSPSSIGNNKYEWLEDQGLFDMEPAPLLDDWLEHLNKPEPRQYTRENSVKSESYPTSNAELVAQKCNFIRHCIDDTATLPEPDWKFGLVGVLAFCENGNDYVHKWSEDYNNYKVEETDKKISATLKFGSPSSCSGIQEMCGTEYCINCEHNGKIKSPIVLGYCTVYDYEPEPKEVKLDLNFPVEVFPEPVQELIKTASFVMDAPLEYFSASILAVNATAINSKAFLKVKKVGFVQPAILWTLLVGEPGKHKKTPVYNLIKSFLDKINDELGEKYNIELKTYKADLQKYEIDLKNWKSSQNTTVEPPEPPKEPVRTLIYTSDTTIEGLSCRQSINPHGIGIMRDELSGFFASFDIYKGGGGNDRPYYLSSYSGEEYVVLRKKDPPYTVRPYHNIFGCIQPDNVAKFLIKDLKVTDGFTERFLFSLTNYTKRAKTTHDEIDQSLINQFEELVREIYKYFSEGEVKYYDLYPDARGALFEIFDKLDEETLNDNHPEIFQSYLVKIKTYVPRFALVLHCMKDHTQQFVTKETIQAAYKVAEYFINCFIAITKISLKSRSLSIENYIIHWLKLHKKDSITASKLYLSNRTKYKSIDKTREYLHSIAALGFGKMVSAANGQKKWVRY